MTQDTQQEHDVHELDVETRQLVKRLASIAAHVAELTSEGEAIKAELRQRLPIGDSYLDGRRAVTLSRTRRFNVTRGLELLDLSTRAQCMDYDGKLVRARLTGEQVEACMEPSGSPRVTLL